MTHRATVERDQAASDVEGNPAAPDWQPHLAAQPCWFSHGTGRTEIVDGEMTVVVEDTQMMVPIGTDITEVDRVTAVVDRRGASQHLGVLNIRAVTPHRTHLELRLQGATA